MSGLEPLAALGLACNIMQIISFAHETASVCKTIYRTGSAAPNLANNVADLANVSENLKKSLSSAPGSLGKDEQELMDIANRSLAAASDLKKEVENIATNTSKGKLISAISGGLKATVSKRRIERLEKSMLDCQRVLESRILLRIWYVSNSRRPPGIS